LRLASPDGGAVSFTVESHVAPGAWAEYEQDITVVAEVGGAVVGTAGLAIGTCRFEDVWVPFGLLHGLGVHPEHRRRGIGAALAEWRLQRAGLTVGEEALVLANIQVGNEASMANARRWATAFTPPVVVAPIPMRRQPPRPRAELRVRPVRDDDLPQVSRELGRQLADRNFVVSHSPADLRAWLAASPFLDRVHHGLVVTDTSGALLAGIGLVEEGRIRTMVVHAVPPMVRAANRLLRVIPADGRMRHLTVAHFWWMSGRLDAARYLVQSCRWEWRASATALLTTYDRRAEEAAALATPWWFPTTTMTVAVRAPRPLSPARTVQPLL
jgi:GNAT superfamily N-acetyltransferase